jgi:hypothetical protein
MLTYKTLKDKAKDFLAATGLKLDEFANLLPAFEAAYVALYPTESNGGGQSAPPPAWWWHQGNFADV